MMTQWPWESLQTPCQQVWSDAIKSLATYY